MTLADIDRWWTEDSADSVTREAGQHFARAYRLEADGRLDEAFAAYAEGNRIKHAALNADTWVAMHTQGVRHLKEVFTPAFFAAHAIPNAEFAPIFIVGLPRSGSTLVEQILATHPRVQGMGETLAMPPLLQHAFPFDMTGALDPADMARRYLAGIRADGWRRKPRFTDKLLANYIAIGHIHLMFPRAVILHTVRDPADTCFSCYRQIFEHDGHVRFAYDLKALGRHYRAYRDMMDHWRTTLLGRVIDVRYESLVADFEGGVRRLLDVCGLDWRDACLRFFENPRAVHTASKDQVRQPIFDHGIGAWRRYRAHLGPLFETLGPYAPADA